MKYLLFVILTISMTVSINAQSYLFFETSSYPYWQRIGKCENNFIYQETSSYPYWQRIGKYENGYVYRETSSYPYWQRMGKYESCGAASLLLLL